MPLSNVFSEIWILGDSIVFWAGRRCRSLKRHNLNLGDGIRTRWHGTRGMRWWQLKSKIQWVSLHRTPKIIIVHLGGNDVVSTKFQKMRRLLKRDFNRMLRLFPKTLIVWSEIPPRLTWKFSQPNSSLKALNNKRKRFNALGRQVLKPCANGRIIKHDITTDCPGLFRADGCHLSDIGIALFCNTLQGAVEIFLSSDIKEFGP